jgi:phosphatidate cytidylyltransferase
MKQRTITAIIFVLVMLAGIFGGELPFLALRILICLGCCWELLRLLQAPPVSAWDKGRLVLQLGLAFVLLTVAELDKGYETFVLILALGSSLLLLFELLAAAERPFNHVSYSVLMILYLVVPFYLFGLLAHDAEGIYKPWRVFSLFLLNWTNDTMAYIIGSQIGKTPFFKRISPKKTWEGTLGGVVCVVLIAALLHTLLPGNFTFSQWLALGGIVAVLGTLGDLVESMLKRSVGAKDSGTIMPGHGGFLDRFDSIILLLPWAWVALRFLD